MRKTPGEMQAADAANLKVRIRKSVQDWARIVQRSGPPWKERVAWLMPGHGIGRVASNMIASLADGDRADFAGIFAGPKAALRPTYQKLAGAAAGPGGDVEVVPCRTQVTLRRKRQFAWIKPGTNTRLDPGHALPGVKPAGRLLPVAGTKDKDRVRLRMAVNDSGAIDAGLKRWLKAAYDLDAR